MFYEEQNRTHELASYGEMQMAALSFKKIIRRGTKPEMSSIKCNSQRVLEPKVNRGTGCHGNVHLLV